MTFERLITICEETTRGFQEAAAAAGDKSLKRLLNLYAQQRRRFAQELLQEIHGSDFTASFYQELAPDEDRVSGDDAELLRECLRTDGEALECYRDALGARIPTRAHFLVSAQYSLMQKAHERIQVMLADTVHVPARSQATICHAAA